MVDKGHKMVQITDKDFKLFRKKCKRVKRMLEDIARYLLIDLERIETQRKE